MYARVALQRKLAATALIASIAVGTIARAQELVRPLPLDRSPPPSVASSRPALLPSEAQTSGAPQAPRPADRIAPQLSDGTTPPLDVNRAVPQPAEVPPPAVDYAAPGLDSNAAGTSGYRNGLFFIRSPDDVFRLYVQGRVHVDHYAWLGPGVPQLPPDQALKNGFLLRRARLEMAGEFFQMWQWQIGAEFAPSAADNAGATTGSPSCKVDPVAQTVNCSTIRENAVESPSVKPAPTDAFVNFAPSPWANLQVGQFFLPFTLENRISDNASPFLERSLPVRAIGAPLQRDIGAMVWGEAPDRSIYYAAGIFNGDGPNRPNADGRYDFAARLLVRPFARTTTTPSKWTQIGASVHVGSRDATQVGYDMPSMTTQEGFAFWKPTYTDSAGRLIHIIPSANQVAVAGDVYVPIEDFDLTAEVIYVDYSTREAADGMQLSQVNLRTGTFKGYGYYAEANYWILGHHDVIGHPSYQRPLHLDISAPQKPPQHGLQVLARFEQMHLTYLGASRAGVSDSKTPNGDIDVDSFTLGINYWATRHLRVGLNYGYYLFPDSAPTSSSSTGGPVQTATQRAVAPAQNLAKGVDDSARDGGHDVHEVSMRVGVQF